MVDNQEPVAYMYERDNGAAILEFYGDLDFKGMKVKPLYTHPAPSWQGLTDDEIKRNATKLGYLWTENSEISFKMDGFLELFALAIEQALKEKNYGN